MRKKYTAQRTSSFMPMDEGNKWVVIDPSGLIYGVLLAEPIPDMKQNEAIALAKKLNEEMANV